MQNNRQFEDKPAKRESVPLLIGGFGPSGGGKTFSALRLASGIQRVTGGDIGFIDTEARRALHYADSFKFRHLDFKAPFGPLDYLASIRHFEGKGIKTIVVDSMSHEHDGSGGVLDQHEDGMNGNEARSMIAWGKPKKQRRELINGILQMNINFVFCFRAKEKIKIVKDGAKNKPVTQGFMPIAGEEFLFEMTVCYLLMPKAGGIPEWNPQESGERLMTKLPEQFFDVFKNPRPIDEEIGSALAIWAKGGKSTPQPPQSPVVVPRDNPDEPLKYRGIVEAVTVTKVGETITGWKFTMKDGSIFSTPYEEVLTYIRENKGKELEIAHFGNQIEHLKIV